MVCIALSGCGTHPRTAASRAPPSESCEGAAPTIDGSREACLLPPYAPEAPGQLADGTPFERSNTASWIFHLPAAGASETAGTEDYTALLERMRARGERSAA